MGFSLDPGIWDRDGTPFQTLDRTTAIHTVNPVGVVHHYLRHRNRLGPTVYKLDFHHSVFRQPNALDRELLNRRKALTKDPDRADSEEYRNQAGEQHQWSASPLNQSGQPERGTGFRRAELYGVQWCRAQPADRA